MQINKCINLFQKVFKIKFSKQQKDILRYSYDKPLVINACAGSGKTTMIMFSILVLVLVHHVSPASILGITYTRAARKNMQDKYKSFINKLSAYTHVPLGKPHFSTFHALFFHIIMNLPSYKHIKVVNVHTPPIFRKVARSVFKVRSLLSRYQLSLTQSQDNTFKKDLKMIFQWSSIMRAKGCSLDGVHNLKDQPLSYFGIDKRNSKETVQNKAKANSVILDAITTYDIAKHDDHGIDFGDMECLLENSVMKHDSAFSVAKQCLSTYHYAFIDEYQDISYVQSYIIDHIISHQAKSHLVMVGDDDQSIYSFRGADPSIIIKKSHSNNISTLPLSTNYRTGNHILHRVIPVISKNKMRIVKHLRSGNHRSNYVRLYTSSESQQFSFYIIMKKLLQTIHNKRSGSIGILTRKNKYAALVADDLANHFYYVHSNHLLQNTKFYKVIVGMMTAIALNKLQPLYFMPGSLTFDHYYLHNKRHYIVFKSIIKKLMGTHVKNITLSDFINTYASSRFPSYLSHATYLVHQMAKIQHLVLHTNHKRNALNILLERSNELVEPVLSFLCGSSHQMTNHLVFFQDYLARECSHFRSFSEFYHFEQNKVDHIKSSHVQTKVYLMTIHSSKGLQFDNVFLPNVDDSLVPVITDGFTVKTTFKQYKEYASSTDLYADLLSDDDDKAIQKLHDSYCNLISACKLLEEERRIFYVGCTRASRHLYLSVSYGSYSHFIHDMQLPKSDCITVDGSNRFVQEK